MTNWPSILPVTAVIALLIFLAKETLEFFRRRNSDKRKVSALKALLARECELNNWTIKSLRSIFSVAPELNEESNGLIISVEKTPSGRPYAVVRSSDGGSEQHISIPKVHKDTSAKLLLEAAVLDKKLFSMLAPAYDGLNELEHVRESLVNLDDVPAFIGKDGYLEGLSGYALGELEDVHKALSALYLHCTNRVLEAHRLR